MKPINCIPPLVDTIIFYFTTTLSIMVEIERVYHSLYRIRLPFFFECTLKLIDRQLPWVIIVNSRKCVPDLFEVSVIYGIAYDQQNFSLKSSGSLEFLQFAQNILAKNSFFLVIGHPWMIQGLDHCHPILRVFLDKSPNEIFSWFRDVRPVFLWKDHLCRSYLPKNQVSFFKRKFL